MSSDFCLSCALWGCFHCFISSLMPGHLSLCSQLRTLNKIFTVFTLWLLVREPQAHLGKQGSPGLTAGCVVGARLKEDHC